MGAVKRTFGAWCIQSGKENLLALYHEQANEKSAEEIPFSSAKLRSWRCPVCGISWKASTNKMNRLVLGTYNVIKKRQEETYCPYCKGERPSTGYNLTTEISWALRFCDFERNAGDSGRLENYLPNSHKRFYLKCPKCGYHFPTPVCFKNIDEALRCPICGAGKSREVTDENCLATKFPKILNELADNLNGGITGRTIRLPIAAAAFGFNAQEAICTNLGYTIGWTVVMAAPRVASEGRPLL